MSNTKNTGGPAFPIPENYCAPGMTLRDHFAGLAMSIAMHQALGTITDEESASAMELVPKLAYAMADAMLIAREQ